MPAATCDIEPVRFFNTTGPVDARDHYCIPPLERLDADHVLRLIGQRRYFVLHAPRQTGKTSALLALMERLNRNGSYRCVHVNVESAQAAREDVGAAMRAILNHMALRARAAMDDDFVARIWPEALDRAGPYGAFEEVLSRWAQEARTPLVLLVDEIDALLGDTLPTVLRQLRAGYDQRPQRFPQSVVLCGVRDVRDYRIHSLGEGALVTGGSAFNVKAASLRLGDFSEAQTRALLAQHAAETGRVWRDDAVALIWELTRGQPWLVNALGAEIVDHATEASDAIDVEAVQQARERLILRRDTHLDQLADKLREERVRRVVEPILSGIPSTDSIPPDDLQYARDLGLVARDDPVAIANPIYREVIPRDLTYTTQAMNIHHEPAWYVDDDGGLRTDGLLAAFQTFFREHSEHWMERFQYREAGPQLLLQAFLQRIVNGGGRIEREYGLGRMRTDLLMVWPVAGDAGRTQKIVIECKVLHRGLDETLRQGLTQTRAYMDRCAATEGHLVIFDRTRGKSWDERVYRREETEGGAPVIVWGM